MIFSNLPLSIQRFLGVALVLAFAIVIVLVMRNFLVGVEGSREDSLRATAEVLALPTIELVTWGPGGGSILLAYNSGGAGFEGGIPRLASMHTTIPTRARVSLGFKD